MAIVDMRTALNLPEEQGDQAFFAVYDGESLAAWPVGSLCLNADRLCCA